MYLFTIKALDAFGHSRLIQIKAQNSEAALLNLKKEGLHAQLEDILEAQRQTWLTRFEAVEWKNFFLKVSKKELYRLIKLMGHALIRGRSLKHSLEFIAENEDDKALKNLVNQLIKRMEKPFGSQVEIFADFPQYFDEAFLGIVEAGEASSYLGEYLVDYSQERKKQALVRQRFMQLLTKRLVTFLMVIGVGLVVILFVIPQFQGLFGDQLEMPWAMKWLMNLSDFFKHYGIYLFIITLLIGATFTYFLKYHPKIRWKWHHFLLSAPLLGRTLRTYHTTQFAYLLSTLLTKNVDVIKSLNIIIGQTRNVCMADSYRHILARMQAGDDLFSAIVYISQAGQSYLIPTIVQAAKVGSETASLGETLMDVRHDLSELFNLRLDRAIKIFSRVFYAVIILMAVFMAYAIGSGIITFYNNAQNLI